MWLAPFVMLLRQQDCLYLRCVVPTLPCTCRNDEALHAFAEDVYYCSLEYGPEDVRTSLGYYNLAKVFQGLGQLDKTLACGDQASCKHHATHARTHRHHIEPSQILGALIALSMPLVSLVELESHTESERPG
jgi:hypothetical protein